MYDSGLRLRHPVHAAGAMQCYHESVFRIKFAAVLFFIAATGTATLATAALQQSLDGGGKCFRIRSVKTFQF